MDVCQAIAHFLAMDAVPYSIDSSTSMTRADSKYHSVLSALDFVELEAAYSSITALNSAHCPSMDYTPHCYHFAAVVDVDHYAMAYDKNAASSLMVVDANEQTCDMAVDTSHDFLTLAVVVVAVFSAVEQMDSFPKELDLIATSYTPLAMDCYD